MTPEKRKKLVGEMEHAYRSASMAPNGPMQAALDIAEQAIRDDALEEAAAIVQLAREGEIDTDFRSIIYCIKNMKGKP